MRVSAIKLHVTAMAFHSFAHTTLSLARHLLIEIFQPQAPSPSSTYHGFKEQLRTLQDHRTTFANGRVSGIG
jgi:hypothetical protein